MTTYTEAQNIISGSKHYEFIHSEESRQDTTLEITSYYTGESVRLDLSRLTPEMLQALQVSDGGKPRNVCVIISEQVDVRTNDGVFIGTNELRYDLLAVDRNEWTSLWHYLRHQYPECDWRADDGEDWDEIPDTNYCQYVHTIDAATGHILLASFDEATQEG